jgi:hypothetical protein
VPNKITQNTETFTDSPPRATRRIFRRRAAMEDTEAKQATSPSPLFSFSNASFGFGFGAAPGPPPPPPPPAVEVLLSEVFLLRFLFLLARLRALLRKVRISLSLPCRNCPSWPATWSPWWLTTPCRFTRCGFRSAYFVFAEMPLPLCV